MDSKYYKIIIAVIIALFLIDKAIYVSDENVKKEIIVTPESIGGESKKIDSIKTDTIYLPKYTPGKARTIVKTVVDSLYKKQYEDAVKENDTLKAKNLFLESISLDTFKGVLIDDKDVRIDGTFVTRGRLLEYDVKYKIKSDTISYTPKTVIQHPKLSLMYGGELGVNISNPENSDPIAIGRIGLQFKKGSVISAGISSQGHLMLGYSRSIRLF